MIVDQYGRPLPVTRFTRPTSGQSVFVDPVSDRDSLDASRRLTPALVDRMMIMANGGDTEELCRLARELPEKSHDIRNALETRRNALLGCKWEIMPGDDSEAASVAARAIKTALDDAGGVYPDPFGALSGFPALMAELQDACLCGFAASEIVWRPGGTGFYGFRPIEQRFFSFTKSFSPRVRVTGNYDGIELPPGKLVFHRLNPNGPDPARGGLIRPLAWLHCFANLGIKDLLSFVERYGMPFVVAKIDDATRKSEGLVLNNLIRSFGPNGGGIFSRNTELELLQAANNTGDVYFRLLEYVGDAITKVILGQTASSGDAGGLSKGDAQSQVRQDILDADARMLEDTIRRDVFAPFVRYNWGPGVPVPKLVIQSEGAEDTAALAGTIKTLHEAGFQADPAEVGAKFGLTLTLIPQQSAAAASGIELAEPPDPVPAKGALEQWLDPVAREIEALTDESDPADFADRLADLAAGKLFGDSAPFEEALGGMIVKGVDAGKQAARRQRRSQND